MTRNAFHMLAAGAVALATASPAVGDPACCSCGPVCAPPVAQVVAPTPMYIVNQGPVYSGPGSRAPYPRIAVETPPQAYPYVGYDYPSLPYTGGPYADPMWHHVHHRYMHYQRNPYSLLPGVYQPNVGPKIIRVTTRHRTVRRGTRHLIQPLSSGDK